MKTIPPKKDVSRARTFKISKKDQLALDMKKQELKLKKITEKSKKNIEIFYDDAQELKENVIKKEQMKKEFDAIANSTVIHQEPTRIDYNNMNEKTKAETL